MAAQPPVTRAVVTRRHPCPPGLRGATYFVRGRGRVRRIWPRLWVRMRISSISTGPMTPSTVPEARHSSSSGRITSTWISPRSTGWGLSRTTWTSAPVTAISPSKSM